MPELVLHWLQPRQSLEIHHTCTNWPKFSEWFSNFKAYLYKCKEKEKRKKECSRYKNQTNFFFTVSHTPSVTGMGTCGIICWHLHLDFPYFLLLPQVHPFLRLQLTLIILFIKSAAFQKLSVTNSNSFHYFEFS